MPRLTNWQKWTLRLLVTVALIIGIFWFIPFSEVAAALRGLNLGYAGAGFALYLGATGLEAIQLWLLLERLQIPIGLWRVFETKFVTRFYAQFLPSELLASAVKLQLLAGPTKQWGEVVAALAFARLANTITLLLFGLVFWSIEMPTGPGRWIGAVMIAMSAALMLLHVTLVSPTLSRYARWFWSSRGLAWVRGTFVEKIRKIISTMVESYGLFGRMVWPIVGLALIRHIMGILMFAIVALALDIHLSLVTIGWIRVVLQGLMMLPIHLSGIGVREGSLVILLQEYSVAPGDAVALAFILFAIHLIGNSLGGLLELKNFLRPKRDELAVPNE